VVQAPQCHPDVLIVAMSVMDYASGEDSVYSSDDDDAEFTDEEDDL